jgi:transposase
MEGSPFLPLCDELQIEQVNELANRLLIQIASRSARACCPLCGTVAERIHSRYRRCVLDLPCVGRTVTLLLTVRKFFCPNPACSRKIFAEQFPDLVPSSARMTNRLSEALQAIGFATCGELGERLAPQLGMQVSAPTLLRCMRTRSYTPPSSVRIVGIDDWAWKKGQTYGTILVDLQTRRPIELLPDRSPETVEAWLRTHPEGEIVSRDRGGDYAAAARKGASQARTVWQTNSTC